MSIRMSGRARVALRRLLALVAGAMLLLHLTAASFADPAMWVIKDKDSTVYLFGTVHLVKSGTPWWSGKLDTAFNSSDELWLESHDAGRSESLRLLIETHGLDPEHPLSTKLDASELAVLDQVLKTAGLPAATIDRMRPWLAALALTYGPSQSGDPVEEVDRSLEARARATHKGVKAFETGEQQILFLSGLSEKSELAFLSQMLELANAEYVDRMVEAWMTGNVAQLDAIVLKRMKGAAPELYDTLIVQRNLSWSDQIATIMKGAGTSFVAVGAGHLAGDRSIQAILQERGFVVSPY